MSMDNGTPNKDFDPRERAGEVLFNANAALGLAVEVITGHTDEDPLEVFPAPKERRADDAGLELTGDQEVSLRAAAAELGFGRTTNRGAEQLGLAEGYAAIIEGGQAHKVVAEIRTVLDDPVQPGIIFLAASPNRKISMANEKDQPEIRSIRHQLGLSEEHEVEETEYSVVRKLLDMLPDFVPEHEPGLVPFSYDAEDGFKIGSEENGQLLHVGSIFDRSVVMLRIDRHNNADGSYVQPQTSDVIQIVDSFLGSEDYGVTDIGFVTSSTYQASREVDGVRAMLETGHNVGVITYGTHQLAKVKGEETPSPASIAQLPGELHKLALQVQKLEELLDQE
jgi:hypothetical protein